MLGRSQGHGRALTGAVNLASNPENLFSVLLFRTAIPKAFRCPINTTNFFLLVMTAAALIPGSVYFRSFN